MQTALNFNQETKHEKLENQIDLYIRLCNEWREKSTEMLKTVTKNEEFKAKKPSLFSRVGKLWANAFLPTAGIFVVIGFWNGLLSVIDTSTQFARSAFQLVVGG
jgi:hypothetical protein